MPVQGALDLTLPPPSTMAVMSISAPYVERILSGEKQIELRRTSVRFPMGMFVLIYHPQPVQAIVGSFTVGGVVSDTPAALWEQHGDLCGIDEADYWSYFNNAARAYGIVVTDVRRWNSATSLEQLKGIWPAFTPPQRYCLIRAGHPAYLSLVAWLDSRDHLGNVEWPEVNAPVYSGCVGAWVPSFISPISAAPKVPARILPPLR
jgi:predicted transcriptional regulator